MTITDVLNRLESVHRCGSGYTAKCPAHDDRRASLSVSEGSDGRVLLKCHAGCSCEAVAHAMGVKMTDLFPNRPQPQADIIRRTPETEYVYKNLRNEPVFKKVRYAGKQFVWFHMDESDKWVRGRGGKPAPLYNMFDTIAIEFVWVVEGEKDVETLRRYGLPAVSLPDGAKTKWQDEYTEWFSCHKVCIIQDNDEPGRQCANMVASNIYGQAAAIKVLDLSKIWDSIPKHGDVSDFLQAFPQDGVKRLKELAKSAEYWTPESAPVPESGIIRLCDVQSTQTDWLWYPYIPRGKITLLTADPGLGKTFFALYLTACVSNGRPFWGTDEPYRQGETAVYQTAEDGVSDTIKPRLEPMTPNFANILMIDETEEGLSLSDERIEKIMSRHKPALMIFDPLQAYLGADVDMHRANEVRPILAHLAKLAEAHNTAVVLIMHNSKTSQNKALYRSLGTIDIPAVARSMLIMGKDPDCDGRRVICHEKSSLARQGKSMTFEIKPNEGGIAFCGFSDLTADDVLTPSGTYFRASEKRDSAEELLTELLGEKGWCEYSEVKAAAEEYGVNMNTLNKVKQSMNLQTVMIGYEKKRTYWLTEEYDKVKFKEQMNVDVEKKAE